jgi:hypothetical protein
MVNNGGMCFGKLMNIFFPCFYENSDILNSIPCYLKYDLIFLCVLLGIIVLSVFGILLLLIIQKRRKQAAR